MKTYDAIVIGAGQAGGPLAKKLALAGKKTALDRKKIRRRHLRKRWLYAYQNLGGIGKSCLHGCKKQRPGRKCQKL